KPNLTLPLSKRATVVSRPVEQVGTWPEVPQWETISLADVENLMICPYRFLLAKQGIAPFALAHENEALREGQWLHRILERFFVGHKDLGPLSKETVHNEERYLERFMHLTRIFAPREVVSTQLWHH